MGSEMCIRDSGTTTAVQHPPKAHLGLPTTSWLRPIIFDEPSCPYVGQWSCLTSCALSHHDLQSITATDSAISITAATRLTDPTSCKTRTTRHTTNCECNLPKTDHTRDVYSSTLATSKTAASTPERLCPHTASVINRQLWLRQTL